MKNIQNNTGTLSALLRTADGVDTLETNSLCCKAAGIIAPSRATAEGLIPHEKLRGAALADATLNAQDRPLAQPVVGYTDDSKTMDYPSEEKPRLIFYRLSDLIKDRMLLDTAQKRIAELELVNTTLRECAAALNIDSDVLNEQLLEILLERDKPANQLATDTQLIEWLDQRGDLCCSIETSSITFWHEDSNTEGYKHVRDALIDAYQQDQAKLFGGDA